MSFSIVLLHLILATHDFHVSQCEIQYRPQEGQVAVAMHLFIDDLELALNNIGYDSIYLGTEKETKDADRLILEYLQGHFSIELDGKPVSYTLIGKEVSEDLMGLWCYVEALHIPSFSLAIIRNEILLETFDDQKNIVSFEYRGFRKQHFLFDRKDPVHNFVVE